MELVGTVGLTNSRLQVGFLPPTNSTSRRSKIFYGDIITVYPILTVTIFSDDKSFDDDNLDRLNNKKCHTTVLTILLLLYFSIIRDTMIWESRARIKMYRCFIFNGTI